MVVRRVEASQYGEVEFHGEEGVVSECCEGQGRGRACGEVSSGGPGHNESLHRYPLGPYRGGVCGVVA